MTSFTQPNFALYQEKITGQRGKLPVQPLGYVNCTKVIYRGALERKSVFRDVRIKANLDLMFLVNAKKWWIAWRYSLSMKVSIKMKENGISTSRIRSWNSVRTSRETYFCFRLRLKITLEESTYPNQRP